MILLHRLAFGLLILGFASILPGCAKENSTPAASGQPGNPAPQQQAVKRGVPSALETKRSQNNLKEIVLMYHAYADKNNKPPAKTEDLKEVSADFAKGYKGLEDGFYEVAWSTHMKGVPGGPDSILRAWEKEPDGNGNRNVITGGGIVKTMSAEEFETARKTKGK